LAGIAFCRRFVLLFYQKTNIMAKSRRKKSLKPQGNLYDKIFKENAESIFIPLVEERLGVKIKQYTPLKEKMQTTIEREMDFFYEVLTDSGESFILHLEFQTEDDAEMLARAQEYHGMAYRRKRMEIRHVVVYLGTTESKMETQLDEKFVFKGFELLKIHDLDTQQLLSSQVPQVVLLAILANYPKKHAESVLRLLVKQLLLLSKNKSELSRYFKQLMILARLRKIEDLTVKITEEMPIVYDIQTDYLFLKGIEEGKIQGKVEGIEEGKIQGKVEGIEEGKIQGIEEGKIQGLEESQLLFIKSLLSHTDFSNEKIAQLIGCKLKTVQQMRTDSNVVLSPLKKVTKKRVRQKPKDIN
jgi:predicted transposase YdaD